MNEFMMQVRLMSATKEETESETCYKPLKQILGPCKGFVVFCLFRVGFWVPTCMFVCLFFNKIHYNYFPNAKADFLP